MSETITNSPVKRRSFAWVGVCGVVFSIFAFLVGFGMPGVGWLLAVLALLLLSLFTPLIGKRFVIIGLLVSLLHLFMVGPLSILGKSMAIPLWPPSAMSIIFVMLPLLAALLAVFLPKRFLRTL